MVVIIRDLKERPIWDAFKMAPPIEHDIKIENLAYKNPIGKDEYYATMVYKWREEVIHCRERLYPFCIWDWFVFRIISKFYRYKDRTENMVHLHIPDFISHKAVEWWKPSVLDLWIDFSHKLVWKGLTFGVVWGSYAAFTRAFFSLKEEERREALDRAVFGEYEIVVLTKDVMEKSLYVEYTFEVNGIKKEIHSRVPKGEIYPYEGIGDYQLSSLWKRKICSYAGCL